MPMAATWHPPTAVAVKNHRPLLLQSPPATWLQRSNIQFSCHPISASRSKNSKTVVAASSSNSSNSFDELDSESWTRSRHSKKSIIMNLVQEIEPLDVSLIQKDVPANAVDAMKRTVSGMLGLLPSSQFHVEVEALWGPLSKLLTSSMKTGYTLRNAEYRLCLERNLDIHEEGTVKRTPDTVGDGSNESLHYRPDPLFSLPGSNNVNSSENANETFYQNVSFDGQEEVSAEAKECIRFLQSRLDSTEKELYNIKRKISALQMQQFVGEEKNDLLDYLRSLQPEKVAELSEPSCPGVEESIHSVVHGLLATLSPKIQSKLPPHLENATGESLGTKKDDYAELVEDTSLQFQPIISVPRDYLARLLFWCMLLGHYIRGIEYRLDLMQLFRASGEPETILCDGDSVA